MPQVRKDTIRERIAGAALTTFARDGWEGATMAAIAAGAGVSIGNVYRYFPNKEALLDAVLGEQLVAQLRALLRRRVAAADGVADVDALAQTAPFHTAGEELLRLAVDHRLRLVLLLGRAAGTRYEPVAGELIAAMKALALEHFRRLDPALQPSPSLAFVLDGVYRAWLRQVVDILASHETEAAIRTAVADFMRYHLSGLRALFEGQGESASQTQRQSRRP